MTKCDRGGGRVNFTLKLRDVIYGRPHNRTVKRWSGPVFGNIIRTEVHVRDRESYNAKI